MKVAINNKVGGFNLSHAAILTYWERKGRKVQSRTNTKWGCTSYTVDGEPVSANGGDIPRNDPVLIQIIEEMGQAAANCSYCLLKIVDIPDGVEYEIVDEFDGSEHIAEKHRTWE
jgi:hypothetical protein